MTTSSPQNVLPCITKLAVELVLADIDVPILAVFLTFTVFLISHFGYANIFPWVPHEKSIRSQSAHGILEPSKAYFKFQGRDSFLII